MMSSNPIDATRDAAGPPRDTPFVDARMLEVVIATARRGAYDAGYNKAITDVLAAGVFVAESALRDAADPADARAVLYRFVADLERHARRLGSGEGVVSDGLGI